MERGFKIMTIIEAGNIVLGYEYWEEKSCSCCVCPPCPKCVESPSIEEYNEAIKFIDNIEL